MVLRRACVKEGGPAPYTVVVRPLPLIPPLSARTLAAQHHQRRRDDHEQLPRQLDGHGHRLPWGPAAVLQQPEGLSVCLPAGGHRASHALMRVAACLTCGARMLFMFLHSHAWEAFGNRPPGPPFEQYDDFQPNVVWRLEPGDDGLRTVRRPRGLGNDVWRWVAHCRSHRRPALPATLTPRDVRPSLSSPSLFP